MCRLLTLAKAVIIDGESRRSSSACPLSQPADIFVTSAICSTHRSFRNSFANSTSRRTHASRTTFSDDTHLVLFTLNTSTGIWNIQQITARSSSSSFTTFWNRLQTSAWNTRCTSTEHFPEEQRARIELLRWPSCCHSATGATLFFGVRSTD